jgi:FeS assembly SUF system protein
MEHVADKDMVENAVGEEYYDELAEPPNIDAPDHHSMWPKCRAALQDVYDPEIPVNIYELGLIYMVDIQDGEGSDYDLYVQMTLTSPACPVAQEMPGMVQGALFPIDGVGEVDVEIVWDPPWDPSMMAETAKLQLNMFM